MACGAVAKLINIVVLILICITSTWTLMLPPIQPQKPTATLFTKIDAGVRHWQVPAIFFENTDNTTQPVHQLLTRLLGNNVTSNFTITLQADKDLLPAECNGAKYDWGLVESADGHVTVKANNVLAATWAVGHYLKYHANLHVSWSGSQMRVPATQWPNAQRYCLAKLDRLQYYQNVCTLSYSYVWWNWARWERELDFMALNGINFALAFVGQEELFYLTFAALGVPEADLDDYFSGPAFLAWHRMGNIQKWGGPLPRAWRQEQLSLQRIILQRMKQLGIVPIMPAFAGHVPPAFAKMYPNDANFTKLTCWNGFNETYSCTDFLSPVSPLFNAVTQKFLAIMSEAYGDLTSHFYNIDLFNEMRPESGDAATLAKMSRKVYEHLSLADSKAIWVMQGWMFENDRPYWNYERAKALLTAVELGSLLVLDLQSDMTPVFGELESYFGQPFIWCMLNNYGGVSGLYGRLHNITLGPITTRSTYSSMAGIGTTMEGINQNDAVFEYVNEMSWRSTAPNVSDWFSSYAVRRYGLLNDDVCSVEKQGNVQSLLSNALIELATSVWNCTIILYNHGRYEFLQRPSLKLPEIPVWYNISQVKHAYELMQLAVEQCPNLLPHRPSILPSHDDVMEKNATFLNDFIDVQRQLLQVNSTSQYRQLAGCFLYDRNNSNCLVSAWKDLNSTLNTLERELSRVPNMRLDGWIRDARAQGASTNSSDLFEWNARNQLTLWGPVGNIVDYAAKQWHGLMSQYYQPRWQLFYETLRMRAVDGTEFNQTAFNVAVFEQVELPFTMRNS